MNIAFISNLAGPDMILILLIVLLLFGAKKLPELAKGMGQAVREFNKAKDEIEKELTKPANEVTVQPAPNKQEYLPPAAQVAAPQAPPVQAPTIAEVRPKEEPAPQVTNTPLL